jgi:hypothetical protein
LKYYQELCLLVINTISKLLFYVPDNLTVGEELELEVRNKLNDSVNDIRSGRLIKTLTVV